MSFIRIEIGHNGIQLEWHICPHCGEQTMRVYTQPAYKHIPATTYAECQNTITPCKAAYLTKQLPEFINLTDEQIAQFRSST